MKHLIIFLLLFSGLSAAVPPLERTINLELSGEEVVVALTKIREQTGLVFSYRAGLIEGLKPVSCRLKNKTVREALSLMLPGHITYKSKSNYIILKEVIPGKKNRTEVSGYVYDKVTETKIPNVTIYDTKTLESVTTDEYGYFNMTVPVEKTELKINKENYQDTTIGVTGLPATSLATISIVPRPDTIRKDSAEWRMKLKDLGQQTNQLFKKFKGYIHTVNVTDSLSRHFQVSFLPFLGTNHALSANVYNDISVNVLGGYARGVNGFEVGGLFNLDKESMRGFQAAGVFNLVGESAEGVQMAGVFNINGSHSTGYQGAGIFNLNEHGFRGLQAAGIANINNSTLKGTSLAGIMNKGYSVRGIQAAGIANTCSDTLEGIALAGLFNRCGYSEESFQVGGLFNTSGGGNSRIQVAGLFNRAGHVSLLQLAPFNFADSVTGIPIGLLSFVKNGVHQLEISGDELIRANLSFRTGVPAFYNILNVGSSPGKNTLWLLGYGLGTSFRINGKLRGDINASVNYVKVIGTSAATSDLYRFFGGIEYRFGKNISLAAGPTFNIYVSDTYESDYTGTYSNVAPYHLSEETNRYGFNFKSWVGGKICLRFF